MTKVLLRKQKSRALLSFLDDFLSVERCYLWKDRNSLPDFPAKFSAVQFRDISKNLDNIFHLWKNRNSLPDFAADFCAVQLRDISKKLFL